jgi:DNA recombination protein Rad52
MDKLKELQLELDKKIPASAVAEREGTRGAKLSYLHGHYVINRLNTIFGSLGWASDIKHIEKLFEGRVAGSRGETNYVSYRATIRIVVEHGGIRTEHTDIGFGDGQDSNNPGKAHELALKEAVTDGIKRCAKNLGMSMGLALYDKDQPNVEDEAPKKVDSVLTTALPSAKLDLGKTLEQIGVTSKVLVAKQYIKLEDLKAVLKDKYGVGTKESLNGEQAAELLGTLKNLLKEKSNEHNQQQ